MAVDREEEEKEIWRQRRRDRPKLFNPSQVLSAGAGSLLVLLRNHYINYQVIIEYLDLCAGTVADEANLASYETR